MKQLKFFFTGLILSACASTSGVKFTQRPMVKTPIVIAHRGASGYLPEHTMEAYTKAIEMGADFIEPDLVLTKDGILIARHENEISGTTDVAAKFPKRKVKKKIDGADIEGYFTEDFTLAEIKTLRAKERLSTRSKASDGKFSIPTFEDVLTLAQQKSKELGREIGVYPETKHPTYFRSINLPMEEKISFMLNKFGLNTETSPVIIQSFEPTSLKKLSRLTPVRLVQLIDENGAPFDYQSAGDKRTYADLTTPEGLQDVKAYAQGVGPYKRLIIPTDKSNNTLPPTKLVENAHKIGLFVHTWTFRNETSYLAADYKGSPQEEYKHIFSAGVDGVFSDFADTAVEVRNAVFGVEKK